MADPASEAAAELAAGSVDCLPAEALAARLRTGEPLRVKLGIDPTAPDIHLGHTVVLRKLRDFQDAGHTVVLIIGDYTARVGDPSGRSATRPVLSGAQIDANARTFQEQAFSVLDRSRIEVRRNSEWLDMSMEDLFRLIRHPTVAQLLERDDFAKRWAAQEQISLLELLYPVLQGYDSVAVRSDVELGGTDQKFNLLMGRAIQTAYGQAPQTVMTMPILPGIDGVRRMGKSLGNYVGITDAPEEAYGKTLRLPDAALGEWYRLLERAEVPPGLGPRDAKRELARRIVTRFHGPEAALAAEAHFDRVFIAREVPADVEEVVFAGGESGLVHVPALVAEHFGRTRSDARRLLEQGGVKLDGRALDVSELDLPAAALDGQVLQVGKRHFRRLRLA